MEMSEEQVKKIWWDLTTEWEKVKGQLTANFNEQIEALRRQELDTIVEAMTMLGEKGEKTLGLLDSFSKTMTDATLKIAEAIVGLRERLEDVEQLILTLRKEK